MSSTKSTKATKITINTTQPAKDTVLEASNLVKYLTDRIKVKGKAGALGKDVEVSLDKKDAYLVSVSSTGDVSLSKRYIKYLTKKYLKNQKIKEYVRVVSCKGGYEMKYFNIQADEDEDDEEDE